MNKLLENDLKIIEKNNLKLFNKPLTTAQKIAYKKNGKLKPFHQLHINNLLLFQKQLNKIRKARIEFSDAVIKEL